MSDTQERDERLALVLDDALSYLRKQGVFDIPGAQVRHPELATALPGLIETMSDLEAVVTGCREGASSAPADCEEREKQTLPTSIGRYQILARLGVGGMGTVWKAHDPQLDRIVALKVPRFDPGKPGQAAAAQRFLREAKAAAKVHHPHVCPIHDFGTHDGSPYAVMEFIEGSSLAELLHESQLPVARAVELTCQVALALEAVHAQGIVHRDLKPGNVLVDRYGQPFLTDFGLARPIGDEEHLTQEGMVVGTPAYLAPEQAAGRTDGVGAVADIYSLGVMLYQMLTHRLPFLGPPITLIYHTIHSEPPTPRNLRPDLDPELEVIVLKAMAKKPELRYRTASAFASALRGWREPRAAETGDSVAYAPTKEELTPSTPPRRWRPWPWLAAVLLLGVVLVLQVVVRIRQQDGKVVEVKLPGNPQAIEVEQDGRVMKVPLIDPRPDMHPLEETGAALIKLVTVRNPVEMAGVQGWSVAIRRPERSNGVRAFALSPKAERLGLSSPSSQLWSLSDSKQLWNINDGPLGNVVSWAPDGKRMASCGTKGYEICESSTGMRLVAHQKKLSKFNALAWSPDDRVLAVAEARTGLIQLVTAPSLERVHTLQEKGDSAALLAWAPDGRLLASAHPEGRVRLWNAETGKLHNCIQAENDPIIALNWLPESRKLFIGQDGAYCLLKDAQLSAPLKYAGSLHKGAIVRTSVSADETRIATGGADGTVRIWELRTGRHLGTFSGHTRPVDNVAWLPDKRRVISTDEAALLRCWDVEQAAPLGIAVLGEHWLVVGPQGHFKGAPGAEKQLRFLVQTEAGTRDLSAEEFALKYGWKNDPSKARLLPD